MKKEMDLVAFQGKSIRRTIHQNERWFVINDVIVSLTDSSDPAQYFKRLKMRDDELAKLFEEGGGTICTTPYAGGSYGWWKSKDVLLECCRDTASILIASRRLRRGVSRQNDRLDRVSHMINQVVIQSARRDVVDEILLELDTMKNEMLKIKNKV